VETHSGKATLEMHAFVYILASRPGGALYVGVTTDLSARLEQHRASVTGHTAKYGIHRLVHLESYAHLDDAQVRERRLKKWNRAWKIELIESGNPEWRDLIVDINR
jgi:putative endonuclease